MMQATIVPTSTGALPEPLPEQLSHCQSSRGSAHAARPASLSVKPPSTHIPHYKQGQRRTLPPYLTPKCPPTMSAMGRHACEKVLPASVLVYSVMPCRLGGCVGLGEYVHVSACARVRVFSHVCLVFKVGTVFLRNRTDTIEHMVQTSGPMCAPGACAHPSVQMASAPQPSALALTPPQTPPCCTHLGEPRPLCGWPAIDQLTSQGHQSMLIDQSTLLLAPGGTLTSLQLTGHQWLLGRRWRTRGIWSCGHRRGQGGGAGKVQAAPHCWASAVVTSMTGK